MTTLGNRPNTALLVIDAQMNALARTHDRDAVVATYQTAPGRTAATAAARDVAFG
jgi:hypothetical protein